MKPEKSNHETAHSAATPGEYFAAEDGADNASADSTSTDRLQWLAFCYVADELTASERADFESQLSTELKAQEALASAVELSYGIHQNYVLQAEPAIGSTLLERSDAGNLTSDRSSTLSRMLLMAAAVLVMAVIGYGLIQNSNQNTAHNNFHDQSSATSQLSILADDWINSLDDDEIEIAGGDLSELSELEEIEESTPLLDSSAGDDLGVDAGLISFYSEILDSEQEDSLLNSKSLRRKTGVDL